MTTKINESVVLRTLTGKSTMWFGKFEGLKVQQILDLHYKDYLRWVYYNIHGVTFVNEILKEITINETRMISKPGIAPEMHDKVFNENRKNMHLFTKNHNDRITRIRAKVKYIDTCQSVFFTKGQLQAINHSKM
jgi:hypothetical protein